MKKLSAVSPRWLYPMLWLLQHDRGEEAKQIEQQELKFGPSKKPEER